MDKTTEEKLIELLNITTCVLTSSNELMDGINIGMLILIFSPVEYNQQLNTLFVNIDGSYPVLPETLNGEPFLSIYTDINDYPNFLSVINSLPRLKRNDVEVTIESRLHPSKFEPFRATAYILGNR